MMKEGEITMKNKKNQKKKKAIVPDREQVKNTKKAVSRKARKG